MNPSNQFFETLLFTGWSSTYDFLGDGNSVQVFSPAPAPRGTPRSRMQQHGTYPRNLFFDGLVIDHEGLFIRDTQSDLVAERDSFLAALLGDLSVPPTHTNIGTLTVKYLGWSESASASVQIDSYAAGFAPTDIHTFAYQIQWRCDLPYFVGDSSGDPVIL